MPFYSTILVFSFPLPNPSHTPYLHSCSISIPSHDRFPFPCPPPTRVPPTRRVRRPHRPTIALLRSTACPSRFPGLADDQSPSQWPDFAAFASFALCMDLPTSWLLCARRGWRRARRSARVSSLPAHLSLRRRVRLVRTFRLPGASSRLPGLLRAALRVPPVPGRVRSSSAFRLPFPPLRRCPSARRPPCRVSPPPRSASALVFCSSPASLSLCPKWCLPVCPELLALPTTGRPSTTRGTRPPGRTRGGRLRLHAGRCSPPSAVARACAVYSCRTSSRPVCGARPAASLA